MTARSSLPILAEHVARLRSAVAAAHRDLLTTNPDDVDGYERILTMHAAASTAYRGALEAYFRASEAERNRVANDVERTVRS